jgi:hypothetical protein
MAATSRANAAVSSVALRFFGTAPSSVTKLGQKPLRHE